MKNFKKIMAILVFAVIFTVVSVGCGNDSKLAASFDEDTVKQQAMDDITLGESINYEGWKARFNPELQAKLTEDIYNNYQELLKENGAFVEFGKAAVVGQKKDGNNYAVVVILVKHENGDMKYTVSYNEKMELLDYLVS